MEVLGGAYFGVAGAGESHGPAISTIVFGCPPGLWLERTAIQAYLDRRRPGSNKHGTPRHEADKVLLLSGLYQADNQALLSGATLQTQVGDDTFQTEAYEAGYTTGEPIAALVLSTSKKSQHYEQFADLQGAVRPGHTDLVKHYQSQGFVDFRGGGRSSYRATISDVIGGSIARILLQKQFGTVILSSICQVGALKATHSLAAQFGNRRQVTPEVVLACQNQLAQAEIHSIDADFAQSAAQLIKQTRITGDSIGAAVEVVAVNVPPLLGAPLYHSLKLRLLGSLGGLHAAQSCEIGDGWDVVTRTGSQNNDPIRASGYAGNHHGGLLGGITTGNPLVMRVGFKPTSTITRPQQSIRKNFSEIDFELQAGRHDPCVGVRAGVTLESRMAIELLNALLQQQAQHIHPVDFTLFPSS